MCDRDLVFVEAMQAGCAPEKEKGNLLPGRSMEDGAPPRQDAPPRCDERRRPADIWFPRGVGERAGRRTAVDFAITSGMRADRIGRAKDGGQAIADDYAITKSIFSTPSKYAILPASRSPPWSWRHMVVAGELRPGNHSDS